MSDIFLSYDKRDSDIAVALARHLEQAGFIVWWDTQLVGGETFREAIEKQLVAAKAVIVIWTGNSVQSKWVQSEAEHASKADKLVPLRTSDLAPQAIPMPFAQWQTELVENRPAVLAALRRLGVEPRYAPTAGGSLHDRVWKEIESSEHPEDFEFYLKEFPEGPHVSYAKLKLARLNRVIKATPVPASDVPQVADAPRKDRPSGQWGRRIATAVGLLAFAGLGGAGVWQMQQLTTQLTKLSEDVARTGAEVDRPRLADTADWTKANGTGLLRDWRGYLARRPVGLHAEEAQANIKKRLFDGRQIAKLEGHDDSVLSVQLEPDGAHMTTRSENGQTIVWKMQEKAIDRQSRGERIKKAAKTDYPRGSISQFGTSIGGIDMRVSNDGKELSWSVGGVTSLHFSRPR